MFKEVVQKHDKVIIVAGGESFAEFDLNQLRDFDGAVITVNNVINHLPRADYWITVDPMTKELQPQPAMVNNEEITKRLGTYFYCAFPDLDKTPWDLEYYKKVDGIHYLERILPEQSYALQEDKDKITTGDSVYGALGLAYHFGATQIAIFGLDVYGYGHWYDLGSPYNGHRVSDKRFEQYKTNLVNIFRACLPQLNKRGINVYNGSKNSRIDAFERYEPQEAFNLLINSKCQK